MPKFESKYAIGDRVYYSSHYNSQAVVAISPDDYGTIASILFTKGKVFYNILNDYSGTIDTKIDSLNVIKKVK